MTRVKGDEARGCQSCRIGGPVTTKPSERLDAAGGHLDDLVAMKTAVLISEILMTSPAAVMRGLRALPRPKGLESYDDVWTLARSDESVGSRAVPDIAKGLGAVARAPINATKTSFRARSARALARPFACLG